MNSKLLLLLLLGLLQLLPLAHALTEEDLFEVSFTGVVANACGSHGKYPPNYAFQGTFWHSDKPLTLPCSLWFEFPVPIRVVKYFFTSRPDYDHLVVPDGPSNYSFWGSNHNDCSQETSRIALLEDNSGTPFERTNKPKTERIQHSDFYRCYGFTVNDVPGRITNGQYIKRIAIGNVHLYSEIISDGGMCVEGVRIRQQCLSFSEEKLNWYDAKSTCASRGGRLAVLTHPEDVQAHVFQTYADTRPFWAGGSDTGHEGGYVWLSDETFDDQFPWGIGEPNQALGNKIDYCLTVHWKDGYNDAPCTRRNSYGYVCELGFVPEGEDENNNQLTVIIGCTVGVLLIVVIAAIVLTHALGFLKNNANQQSNVPLQRLID